MVGWVICVSLQISQWELRPPQETLQLSSRPRIFQLYNEKGAWAALAGKLDFSRGKLTLGFCGVDMPFGGNDMGRYFSSVVDSGGRRGELASNPNLSAPMVEWAFSKEGSNFPNGGTHMPLTGWGNLPKKREWPPIF